MTESAAHPWQPPYSASNLCGAMVMRDGGGDECGLLRDHPVHLAAFQAVIDYQREQLRIALNPLLRPTMGRGYVPTPDEAHRKRLRELGYGV